MLFTLSKIRTDQGAALFCVAAAYLADKKEVRRAVVATGLTEVWASYSKTGTHVFYPGKNAAMDDRLFMVDLIFCERDLLMAMGDTLSLGGMAKGWKIDKNWRRTNAGKNWLGKDEESGEALVKIVDTNGLVLDFYNPNRRRMILDGVPEAKEFTATTLFNLDTDVDFDSFMDVLLEAPSETFDSPEELAAFYWKTVEGVTQAHAFPSRRRRRRPGQIKERPKVEKEKPKPPPKKEKKNAGPAGKAATAPDIRTETLNGMKMSPKVKEVMEAAISLVVDGQSKDKEEELVKLTRGLTPQEFNEFREVLHKTGTEVREARKS